MNDDFLVEAIPDIVAFVRRDGLITHQVGGRDLPLIAGKSLPGCELGDVFAPETAELLGRLIRRALANRENCVAEFADDGYTYCARVVPQGPARALCIIRQDGAVQPAPGPAVKKDFVKRMQRSIAHATLRERPLALAMIFLEGLREIGRLIDFSVAECVQQEVMSRLAARDDVRSKAAWQAEPLGEGMIGVVIEGVADSARIHDLVAAICQMIVQPVHLHGAEFQLQAYAGVAIAGRDASKAGPLLERAQAALFEARRAASGTVQFYSDTVRLLPVLRVDIERELRKAIDDGQIDLRYVTRHELASGRIRGIHAYMRWVHPLRGEIAPREFLKIADATNLAVAVSSAALSRLALHLPRLHQRFGAGVSVSFGALRQHVTSGQLLRDCRQLLGTRGAERANIELRISERTLASLNRPERLLGESAEFSARWVVDEMGRGFSSFAALAKLPLAALQVDRSLVIAACSDAAARRSCRALFALAGALDVLPVAVGVDDETTRELMLSMGCSEGLGDLFPAVAQPGPADEQVASGAIQAAH